MPLGARPVFQLSTTARLLIISQAPGTKVHLSGLPFDDASGDRLRGWMGIGRDVFYNATKLNIMGMGFCYPGRLPNGGDAPPRPECAPLWHDKLLALMPQIELILLVGGYAQRRYLGKGSMTEMVRAQEQGGRFMPLPHPSWRTTAWERKNPWFAEEVLPRLQAEVARLTA
ncbi:MAG: uracil-DNA glycosylase family protein [Proteobacteria bacterium]|nr:uracil-DNA glycosylase family protein [Pseudomonadota bacterium]